MTGPTQTQNPYPAGRPINGGITPRATDLIHKKTEVPARFRLGQRPGLNGLRGVAILLVLCAHGFPSLPLSLGFVGVDIFFVLSGFLITCLLMEEWELTRAISLKAFYMRRALRLLPALIVLLAVVFIFCSVVDSGLQFQRDLAEIRSAVFYYTNWALAFGSLQGSWLRHAWSLSIEEQFYLIWPPLLWLMLRWTKKRGGSGSILNFILLGIFCCSLWRCLQIAINGYRVDSTRLGSGLDTRADALLIGCATALIVCSGFPAQWRWSPRILRIAGATSAIGLALFSFGCSPDKAWMGAVGWSLISLFAGTLILGLVSEPDGKLNAALEAGWITRLGTLSYSLYLWHYPLFRLFRDQLALPEFEVVPLGFGTTAIAAFGSYYLIERPFLRLKRRFKKVAE